MKFKWRKWNRATHRDLGYLFVAMTIIYSLSGIAINHLNDWNPNYVITVEDIQVQIPSDKSKIDKKEVINILSQIGEEDNYKNLNSYNNVTATKNKVQKAAKRQDERQCRAW